MTDAPRFQSTRAPDLRTPRPWHPLRHIIWALDDALITAARELQLPAGARVLDYGCGDRHYRKLVGDAVEYVGADLPGNAAADATINPDGTLSFAPGSFDAVLSTQVLEHVTDPKLYLAECRRLLKPDGKLLLSTHGTMLYHRDPVDYWRWTHDGLRKLVGESGFEVVHFRGVLGLAAVGLQFFQAATYPKLPKVLRAPYAAVMQQLVAWFDRRYSEQTRIPNALVYVLVARRAPDPAARRPGT